MDTLRTCLWFDTQAEEAAAFYCTVFDGKTTGTTHYTEGSMREAGMVMTVDFEVAGMRFTALNGGDQFTFDESISFQVPCRGQEELDHYWFALAEGGSHGQCGWLTDKFGVSWQVYDPEAMARMLGGDDPAGAQRAMQAMLQMTRIDVAELERAYAGE
ncbi:VOC family protein [Solicola sp. PLA-1-18]|uniref:VOC family protein n=1 Tax=Solicola sp. PLA-1-18 TaxID=3380532 RepID=UPI003B779539